MKLTKKERKFKKNITNTLNSLDINKPKYTNRDAIKDIYWIAFKSPIDQITYNKRIIGS